MCSYIFFIVFTFELVLQLNFFWGSSNATCPRTNAFCISQFVLSFQTKRVWQRGRKNLKRWYGDELRQTMVDSWYCLDRPFPQGTSQVSRRLEVGNHKRHTLNTRLSSGTSVRTFACPAGPWRNYWAETGTKNIQDRYFVPDLKKESKNRSSRFEPKKFDFFFEGFWSTFKSSVIMKISLFISFIYVQFDREKLPIRGCFLSIIFLHQELCARRPSLKNLLQILWEVSSFTRFLMREHSK